MIQTQRYFQTRLVPSLGLLLFRVVVGAAFVLHGMGKVSNPTGWMGEGTPAFAQAFAAYAEFLGGAALALGLFTPLAALAIIATMLGALGLAHLPAGHPFVSSDGGASFELALVYLVSALLILINSPGRFSLDYLLARKFGADAAPGKTTESA